MNEALSERPREATQVNSRLLKCALVVEASRAYWQHPVGDPKTRAQRAFEGYWFGAKSMARVKVLLNNFGHRFESIPQAVAVLRRWPQMQPEIRRLICHWHLQFSDPVYRAFTGDYLPQRLQGGRDTVSRPLVIDWVSGQGPGRWTTATRIQLASKLLSCAHSAGLLGATRDPRPLIAPRVPDEALGYLMYLLRGVDIDGSPLDNAYLRSVGLDGRHLEQRLRSAVGLDFSRQGDLVNFGWAHPTLEIWADVALGRAAA